MILSQRQQRLRRNDIKLRTLFISERRTICIEIHLLRLERDGRKHNCQPVGIPEELLDWSEAFGIGSQIESRTRCFPLQGLLVVPKQLLGEFEVKSAVSLDD